MFVICDENTRVPVKVWLADRGQLESTCLEQACHLAQLPFVHKWACLMPDTHAGKGMPIGGVIATDGVIIPNAVGVDIVELDNKLASRSVNEGFSGGEKKRNEIFQMAVLEPRLSILDETDSGLDIDALRVVAGGVNQLKTSNNATIVITHYQRLLDYIKPDFVHVLYKGRIVRTGGPELALELEEKGYDWLKD